MDDLAFLPFDSSDREFVRGFQLGIIYGRWMSEEAGDVLVYGDCAEMLTRMVERGAPITVTIENNEWVSVSGPPA